MTSSDIHFVCTGNTCRSPMAEGLTRFLLFEAGLGDRWSVSSSGLAAFPGDPAAPHALNVLAEKGIDISGHRSCRTSVYSIEKARYVFAMTEGHRDQLLRFFPEYKDRILLLTGIVQRVRASSELLPVLPDLRLTGQNIPDPYGLDLDHYRAVARRIEFCSRLLVHFLRTEDLNRAEGVSD